MIYLSLLLLVASEQLTTHNLLDTWAGRRISKLTGALRSVPVRYIKRNRSDSCRPENHCR